jgi:hypothetical protein
VRDPRFAGLLRDMAAITVDTSSSATDSGGGGDDDDGEGAWQRRQRRQRRRWTPKACALILNGLSHLLREPADAPPVLLRLVASAADCLMEEATNLAPRHISLSLNALARLLPLLVERGGGGEEDENEWGLFVSVMVDRCVPVHGTERGPQGTKSIRPPTPRPAVP